jgi:hypothetical protein
VRPKGALPVGRALSSAVLILAVDSRAAWSGSRAAARTASASGAPRSSRSSNAAGKYSVARCADAARAGSVPNHVWWPRAITLVLDETRTGTSTVARSQERPGDGGSPGACATGRSPRKSPEERPPGRVDPTVPRLSGSRRLRGQRGWYRGAASLVPLPESDRPTEEQCRTAPYPPKWICRPSST